LTRVLLLREADKAAASAMRLAAAGHSPVLLPLLDIADTGARIDARGCDAIAFTSAAAVEVLSRRRDETQLAALRRLPAYCAGEATAAVARKAGLDARAAAGGDAKGVAAQLCAELPAGTTVLYPGAVHLAFDLAGACGACGIVVRAVAVYEAVLIDPGAEAVAAALGDASGGAVFLHSARTARHLLELARRHGLERLLAGLTFVAISENVASILPPGTGKQVLAAPAPNEAAMIGALPAGPASEQEKADRQINIPEPERKS
jgi:uroporphyrinogen-III synthase